MESLQSIWTCLLRGHYTISIDLQDAYFQITIHRSSRKCLRFLFKNTVYPLASHHPVAVHSGHGRGVDTGSSKRISLFLYLDDWLAQMPTYFMGIDLNLKKSELVPNQVFDFIGARFNLILARVFPKEEKCILKIRSSCQSINQSKSVLYSPFKCVHHQSAQHTYVLLVSA